MDARKNVRKNVRKTAFAVILALVGGQWVFAGAESDEVDAHGDADDVARLVHARRLVDERQALDDALRLVIEAAQKFAATHRSAQSRQDAEALRKALELLRHGEMAEMMARRATAWKKRLHRQENGAHLGVMIQDANNDDGVMVARILPDGGAAAAGISDNDVIIEINGESLRGNESPSKALQAELREVSPGDTVRLVVLRDGEPLPFEVVTTHSPAHSVEEHVLTLGPWINHWRPRHWRMDKPPHRPSLALVNIGQDLGEYFNVDAGVLVLNTPAGSELKPGDILQRIGGADVASVADARRLLASAGETVEAQVLRKKRKMTVAVRAEEAMTPSAMQFQGLFEDARPVTATPTEKVVPAAPHADAETETNGD